MPAEKEAPKVTSTTSRASSPQPDETAPENLFIPMYHVQTHQSVDLEDYFKVS